MRKILLRLTVLIITFFSYGLPVSAQMPARASTPDLSQREVIVGIKDAPPFAMKDADGNWHGISIDLWKRAAEKLHLRYSFVEVPTVQNLIENTVASKFDIGVGALTITAAREEIADFTQPYYVTGLGIAVAVGGAASWLPVIQSMTSFGFAQAVLALIGLALATGLLVWLFERRHNEDFGGGIAKGVTSGVWWSASAMTQRGNTEFRPTTLPGRIVAIIWMIVSIVSIAVFTAGLTSALTTKQLQGSVRTTNDLSSIQVGTVSGTATEETLDRMRISFRGFKSAQDGLSALRAGTIDAFVHDRAILAWMVRQHFYSSVELLDITFNPQTYGFILAEGSPLRKPLNKILLGELQNDWWRTTLFHYLGSK